MGYSASGTDAEINKVWKMKIIGELTGFNTFRRPSDYNCLKSATDRGQSWRYCRRRYTRGTYATRGELSGGPVHPRNDVNISLLARSDHTSYCPFKGDANYFNLKPLGDRGTNAIWTYEVPHPAVAAIAGHVAFYPDRVTDLYRALTPTLPHPAPSTLHWSLSLRMPPRRGSFSFVHGTPPIPRTPRLCITWVMALRRR